MTTEPDDGNDGEESGGSLRKKLEAALKENADFKGRLVTLEAQNLIREKGYKLITAEDLKEVGIEDLAKKAESLENERADMGKKALRQSLESRGLTGDVLEQTVAAAFGETEGEASQAALDRIREVGNTTGTPVSAVSVDTGATGMARVAQALAASNKK